MSTAPDPVTAAAAIDLVTDYDGRVALALSLAAAAAAEDGQADDEPLLPDPTTTDQAQTFVMWVEWLRETYALKTEIPSAWINHPPIVGELLGLHLAHQDATCEDAIGADLIRWHDHLDAALHRITTWNSRASKNRMIG